MQIPRQQFALKNSSSECQGVLEASSASYQASCANVGRLLFPEIWAGKGNVVWTGFLIISMGAVTWKSSGLLWLTSVGGLGVPKWDCNSRIGEKMVQASGDSERMIWEHDANLLNSSSRTGDVWQCQRLEFEKWGEAPGMGQDWHCFGRGRFEGLVSACDLSLMCCKICFAHFFFFFFLCNRISG